MNEFNSRNFHEILSFSQTFSNGHDSRDESRYSILAVQPVENNNNNDNLEGISSKPIVSTMTTTTKAASSCDLWMQYLDKLGFPISHLVVLPFLVCILRRSCLIVLQTVPPKFSAIELKEKLLRKVLTKLLVGIISYD